MFQRFYWTCLTFTGLPSHVHCSLQWSTCHENWILDLASGFTNICWQQVWQDIHITPWWTSVQCPPPLSGIRGQCCVLEILCREYGTVFFTRNLLYTHIFHLPQVEASLRSPSVIIFWIIITRSTSKINCIPMNELCDWKDMHLAMTF